MRIFIEAYPDFGNQADVFEMALYFSPSPKTVDLTENSADQVVLARNMLICDENMDRLIDTMYNERYR